MSTGMMSRCVSIPSELVTKLRKTTKNSELKIRKLEQREKILVVIVGCLCLFVIFVLIGSSINKK